MAAKTKGRKEKRKSFSFFSDMTLEHKSTLYRYSGLTVAVLTLFTFISIFSYLFTWKMDQSLLSCPDMMQKGVEVANWGGKLGYKWAELLVSDCFGLGSLALIFLMGAVAWRLCFHDKSIGLLRMTS